MSEENVEKARNFIEAYNARDFDRAIADFDRDIDWVLPEHQAFDSAKGIPGVLRFFKGIDETMGVLQLEPQDPALSGSVSAAFTLGERGIYLQGAGLETLPQDRVYELWVITGDTPAAAVCVRPGEDGSVFAFADSPVAPNDLLAVTVEPSSCSDAPTTAPIWVAPVTTA